MIDYNERANRQIQILKESLRTRIEKSGESIGNIEDAIAVSKGYFSRIWESNRTPDLFILCKVADYFEIDLFLLFSKPLDKMDAREESEQQMINRFLAMLSRKTVERRLLWKKRLCLVDGIVVSQGLKNGIYDVSYTAKDYAKDDFKYRESKVRFTCKLEDGEKLDLFEITSGNQSYYELLLDQDLIYATAGNENNDEGNRAIRSLYQYLSENLDGENRCQKWNCSLESLDIIKKYIEELPI